MFGLKHLFYSAEEHLISIEDRVCGFGGLTSDSQNSNPLKTENLFSNILPNRISKLEKQLPQKDKLLTFLPQKLMEKYRATIIIIYNVSITMLTKILLLIMETRVSLRKLKLF